jgi:hypothetical protein
MMLAAVDLDQLPNARPPHPRLLNLGRPELPRDPQTDRDLRLLLSFSVANVGPKSAYVDLRSLMTRSAMGSSSRLLLGRLKRLEIKATGPAAAYRLVSLRTWRVVSPRRSIEIALCKCHSRVLPHLQSPIPGKGCRNYSWAALKRTFELGQKRTFLFGYHTRLSAPVKNVLYFSRIEMSCWNIQHSGWMIVRMGYGLAVRLLELSLRIRRRGEHFQ